MAISGTTVWEVRTAGNDTNGGGFVATGTDYSQQDTKRTATGTNDSVTDAVSNGTSTITSATANFTAALIGNIIHLSGGSGGLASRWFQVISVTNATTIVVDRATPGASTGCTLNIGGALKTLGGLGFIWDITGTYVAGQRAWFKAGGTFTITNAGTNVATGRLSNNMGGATIEGYNTVRGDNPTGTNRPLFQVASSPGGYLFDFFGGNTNRIAHIRVDGNGVNCAVMRIDGLFYNVKVSGHSTGTGLIGANSGFGDQSLAVYCEVSDGVSSATGIETLNCINCLVKNMAGVGAHGFINNAACYFINCISTENAGYGFNLGNTFNCCYGCVAYDNGNSGFNSGSTAVRYFNCISEDNTNYGFTGSTTVGNWAGMLVACATYNNSVGATSVGAEVIQIGMITGSGTFFTDGPNGDFSLNGSQGALLVGTGYGVYPDGLTVSLPNIGAWQNNVSSPSGGSESFSASFG